MGQLIVEGELVAVSNGLEHFPCTEFTGQSRRQRAPLVVDGLWASGLQGPFLGLMFFPLQGYTLHVHVQGS